MAVRSFDPPSKSPHCPGLLNKPLGVMTADRHELHELVDTLPDDQVARVLADVRRRVTAPTAERPWPPAFFGMGVDKDGRTDLSEIVDEILAGGFGASRS